LARRVQFVRHSGWRDLDVANADDPELANIALEIRKYLGVRSRDFDQIVEWWFKRHWYKDARYKVHWALERLVAQRVLTKDVLPGGRAIYTARKD